MGTLARPNCGRNQSQPVKFALFDLAAPNPVNSRRARVPILRPVRRLHSSTPLPSSTSSILSPTRNHRGLFSRQGAKPQRASCSNQPSSPSFAPWHLCVRSFPLHSKIPRAPSTPLPPSTSSIRNVLSRRVQHLCHLQHLRSPRQHRIKEQDSHAKAQRRKGLHIPVSRLLLTLRLGAFARDLSHFIQRSRAHLRHLRHLQTVAEAANSGIAEAALARGTLFSTVDFARAPESLQIARTFKSSAKSRCAAWLIRAKPSLCNDLKISSM